MSDSKLPSYGGQAVIEGVMMRGEKYTAIAMRAPDDEIILHTEPLGAIYKSKIVKIPFLRGLTLLWDALGLGLKALMFSAEVAVEEEGKEEGEAEKVFEGPIQWTMIALSLSLMILIFFAVPTFLASFLQGWIDMSMRINCVK